jgi:acetylornithine/succinyldiaminopimelate/putrescine aminotransferase
MTEHIKTIVERYVKKGQEKNKQYKEIKNILKNELREQVLEKVKIESTNSKEVVFFLNSSSAAYEFKLQEEKIKNKIKEKLPEIKKIKTKVE